MHLKIVLIVLLIFGWTNLATAILLLNVAMALFGKRYFAGFCSNFSKNYNKNTHALKAELFQELNDMKQV